MFILFLLIFVVLGILSILLSASETALTSASRIKIHHLAKTTGAKARLVLYLQKNMGNVIATILLVNTCVLTCLTALATSVVTIFFGPAGAVYAAIFLSLFITVYLEVLPKMFAFPRAARVAIAVAPMVDFLRRFLKPVIRLVDQIARFSLWVIRIKAPEKAEESSLEELKGAIDLHASTSSALHERAMLKNILDLTRITVSEVMVHRQQMLCLDASMPVAKICAKALSAPYTRIPMWENDPENVIGVLHIKELYRALQKKEPEDIDIKDLLTKAWFIPETATLVAQLQAFRERRAHLAFVVDEYGALVGMLTLEDILEDIVGDIFDEHDDILTGVRKLEDRRYLIQGTVSVRDLNRLYEWGLPEDKATTLAGLLIEVAELIPAEKQVFHIAGLDIKVIEKVRNQVKLLEVTVCDEPKVAPRGDLT